MLVKERKTSSRPASVLCLLFRLPHFLYLITRSSEVLRKSRVRDWILEQWTPSSLWMPEHSMQVRMPKFVESHVGSEVHRRSIIRTLKAGKSFWLEILFQTEKLIISWCIISWPGAPQSAQASLPDICRSSAIMARESSWSPLSWTWSWSPPNAVFRASSLLFCSTETQLQRQTQT